VTVKGTGALYEEKGEKIEEDTTAKVANDLF